MVLNDKPAERILRKKHVGSFLRQMREKAGLTQSQLADELAYSTAQFVSNWERGVSLPPLDALPKIAKLCAIPSNSMVHAMHAYQEAILELRKKELADLFKSEEPRGRRAQR